jgi:hypothetical protein
MTLPKFKNDVARVEWGLFYCLEKLMMDFVENVSHFLGSFHVRG